MKPAKAICITVLVLGLVAVLGIGLLSPPEPLYKGKSIAAWLDILAEPRPGAMPSGESQMEARAALTANGPKAVPYIVRRLEQSESRLRHKYRELFPKLPPFLAKKLPTPKGDLTGLAGGTAFLAIGPTVEPQLTALLESRSTAVRIASAFGLSSLQFYSKTDIRDAVPGLTQGLRAPDAELRLVCATALGRIGPDAATAAATLMPCLNDPETGRVPGARYFVRAAAARSLGQIGPNAKAALPALRALMQDQDVYVRVVAAVAVWRIDAHVTNTLPVLLDGLNKVNPNSAWEVIEGLGEMGPRAKAAIPALVAYGGAEPPNLKSKPPQGFNRAKINEALAKISPDAAGTVEAK